MTGMSWTQIDCSNPDCTASFTVADEYDERECWKCGTTHTAPWDEQQTVKATDGGVPVPADRAGTKPVQQGTTATEATCTRCGTVYDTSRELGHKHLSAERCRSCGTVNTPDPQPVGIEETGEQAAGMQAEKLLLEAMEQAGENGDMHIHFHQG